MFLNLHQYQHSLVLVNTRQEQPPTVLTLHLPPHPLPSVPLHHITHCLYIPPHIYPPPPRPCKHGLFLPGPIRHEHEFLYDGGQPRHDRQPHVPRLYLQQ